MTIAMCRERRCYFSGTMPTSGSGVLFILLVSSREIVGPGGEEACWRMRTSMTGRESRANSVVVS